MQFLLASLKSSQVVPIDREDSRARSRHGEFTSEIRSRVPTFCGRDAKALARPFPVCSIITRAESTQFRYSTWRPSLSSSGFFSYRHGTSPSPGTVSPCLPSIASVDRLDLAHPGVSPRAGAKLGLDNSQLRRVFAGAVHFEAPRAATTRQMVL